VINREYVEDPVYLTLVPEPVFSARRTTILLFYDRGPEQGVERLTVSRYPLQGLYDAAWQGGTLDEQWVRLKELVAERNPRRIGIDTSRHWSFGDGLSSGLHERLVEALGPELSRRLASAEDLCLRWLETRTGRELELYSQAVALARGVVSEAFSGRVITPGATTAADVAWYVRERFESMGRAPTPRRWATSSASARSKRLPGCSGRSPRGTAGRICSPGASPRGALATRSWP